MTRYYKIITYGCQMNEHESEKLAGILENRRYQYIEDIEKANVIVFNTCCIRKNAEDRLLGNLGALKKLKESNPSIIIAVGGCMTQIENTVQLLKISYPFVDIIFGTHNLEEFGRLLDNKISTGKKQLEIIDSSLIHDYSPLHRANSVNAWVNIMYGCNNFCTYCIVPYVRGREISRDKNSILNEINDCLDKGFKEITLLGQNVNSYGNDFADQKLNFASLLEDISKINGKFRVRFMTSHPKDFNQDVIDIISNANNICNYIHLPAQSGSNKVLHDMNRKYTRENYLNVIDNIRKKIPDCGITSDIMVGFPTETEDDFVQTLELCNEARFTNIFSFIYSPRKGTPAFNMLQLDEDIKKSRMNRLLDYQNKITIEECNKMLGKTYEVLCEDKNDEGYWLGRTEQGKLIKWQSNKMKIGDFTKIKITRAKSSVLFGEIEEK